MQETAVLDRLAERRAAMRADAPPVIPPCPSWCVSTTGLHPLDFEGVEKDGMHVRVHEVHIGRIVNVEARERSDGHVGALTCTKPAIVVYGADFDGKEVTSAEMLTMVSELVEATKVRDRLTGGCPSWCAQCQPDGVSSAVNHWSAVAPLQGGDEVPAPRDLEPATISALARKDQGEPLSEVRSTITSEPEHFRSAPQARAFAPAILSFVDSITGASSLTSRQGRPHRSVDGSRAPALST